MPHLKIQEKICYIKSSFYFPKGVSDPNKIMEKIYRPGPSPFYFVVTKNQEEEENNQNNVTLPPPVNSSKIPNFNTTQTELI